MDSTATRVYTTNPYTGIQKYTGDGLDELVEYYETSHLPETRFTFIQAHKSFHGGQMYLLIGTTGVGKSTLVRTILADLMMGGRVFWFSTEEKMSQFLFKMGKLDPNIRKPLKENVDFYHEDFILEPFLATEREPTINEYIKAIDVAWKKSNAKIFFYDNLTCGIFHEHPTKAQTFIRAFRKWMSDNNVPIFAICHTDKKTKDGMLFESSDMRGNSIIAIKAEYAYCVGRFTKEGLAGTTVDHFLRVDKSRNHDGVKEIYMLHYNFKEKCYQGDTRWDWDKFSKAYGPKKGKK